MGLDKLWKIILVLFRRTRGTQMKRVLLDAGHGGDATGAIAGEMMEKELVLDITLETGKVLEHKMSHSDVYYTRIQDKNLSLAGRCKAIMEIKPDAFISIHCNAIADDPTTTQDEREFVHGVEIFYRDDKDKPLAEAVNRLFKRSSIWKRNRGVKQDEEWLGKRLTVLNSLEVPSILVEVGFISNSTELACVLENKTGIAELLAHGIVDFLLEGNEDAA